VLLVVVAILVAVAGENAQCVMSGDRGVEKASRSLAPWVDVVSSPAAEAFVADDKDEDEGKEDEGNDNHANSLFSLSTSLVSSSILSLFTSSAIEYSAAPKSQLEWLSCCESLAS
jgi:hypothetical protein